jgi:hypothetical protein
MNSEASIPPDSIKPKLKRSLATAAKNALDEVVCVSEATIEEWGSSQTPQSQMVQSEGHASAFELFHQQRLRLILRERERALSVTSAPSPGQAMLTKELEENKARQNRQAIIQNGWRTAVEAMLSGNNVGSVSYFKSRFKSSTSLQESNDEEHFEDLMEKVNISSLHPSDDDLIDRSQPDIVVSTGMQHMHFHPIITKFQHCCNRIETRLINKYSIPFNVFILQNFHPSQVHQHHFENLLVGEK